MHIRLQVMVTNLEKCKIFPAKYDDKMAALQFKPANENVYCLFQLYYKIFSVCVCVCVCLCVRACVCFR